MRHANITRWVILVIALSCVCGYSFGQTPNKLSSATAQHPAKRQGFFDYALGKINPHGNDYGASMDSVRNAAVENTIDDLYFWSNAVTLGLLICAAGIIYFEWRSAAKKEIVAATIIAELWNGRVSDRIEILRRTEQFNQLAEQHNAEVERALMAKQLPNQAAEPETTDLKDTVHALARMANARNEDASGGSSDVPGTSLADPSLSGNITMTVQQQVQLLKNSLEATRNSERNLRERLNQTNTQLDEERRRNRTLKGANG